ncbi:unnamed protein product [Rhodiola kirilowii]
MKMGVMPCKIQSSLDVSFRAVDIKCHQKFAHLVKKRSSSFHQCA